MQTIVLYLCYIDLILLFSSAYNTSLIYCFVIWCLHTNKRRPCSSTLSGHPSSSFIHPEIVVFIIYPMISHHHLDLIPGWIPMIPNLGATLLAVQPAQECSSDEPTSTLLRRRFSRSWSHRGKQWPNGPTRYHRNTDLKWHGHWLMVKLINWRF